MNIIRRLILVAGILALCGCSSLPLGKLPPHNEKIYTAANEADADRLWSELVTSPDMLKLRAATCCGSMRPAIEGGERVIVQFRGVAHVGDIISNGKSMHRVTAENDRAVITAGDANKFSDGWTTRDKIQYRVVVIIRVGK